MAAQPQAPQPAGLLTHPLTDRPRCRAATCHRFEAAKREKRFAGIVCVAQDISERKRAEAVLKNHIEQLTILQRVDKELNSKLHVPFVLDMALDAAMRFSRASAGAIELIEHDVIYTGKAIGEYPSEFIDLYPKPPGGIVGRVMRTKQAEMVLDVLSDPDYVPLVPGTRAQICIPLVSQERVVGLLTLETPKPHYFSTEVFDFLTILTTRIAVAIDNARLYDISQVQLGELKELYERVSSLEQIKTDMLRIAAHDLRNPLSVISGFSALLLENDLGEQSGEYVTHIDKAAKKMTKIVNDILSLQRIEAMQGSEQQIVNLSTLVEMAYHEHQEQARQKSLDYRLNIVGTPALVMGDAPQLKEAFDNLINNALKYTPENGRVEVRLWHNDRFVTAEVEDYGYGIPEELQAGLFQPFYRARTSEMRNIDGTGLGLHLVKNIIKRHNGEMLFHSDYGKGSTFGFRMMLAEQKPSLAASGTLKSEQQ